MRVESEILTVTPHEQRGIFSMNIDQRDGTHGAVPSGITDSSCGGNGNRVTETQSQDPFDGMDDDNKSSTGGGGLYMEGCMDFVIDTDENDNVAPVSLAIQSISDEPSPNCHDIDYYSPDNTGLIVNNEHVDSNQKHQFPQKKQEQQCLQQPCPELPMHTGNASVTSDTFLISYSSWPHHGNNDSVAGDLSPAISTSMETMMVEGGTSKLRQRQQHSQQQQQQQQKQPDQLDMPSERGGLVDKDQGYSQSIHELGDEVRSNLFVSGLPSTVADSELYNHFRPYGEIESAKVMLDIHTGKSRGIAFVKFANVANAEQAVDELNNSTFGGETITVRIAKPRAAYRPGAPTNKTFVRNIPLTVKKADIMQHFGRYGEVIDVSIHSDTAPRSTDKRRNVAFITYTTKEAAAAAAQDTHTKTPFADCDGVPLLAKVAEDSAHRIERLARRGACYHGSSKNSLTSANNSVSSAAHCPQHAVSASPAPHKALEHVFAASAPVYPFASSMGRPIITDAYAGGGAAPAFYAAPFFPMATGPGGAAPLFLVSPEPRPAMFAPPVDPASFGGSMGTVAPMSKSTDVFPSAGPQLMMHPQTSRNIMPPQSTFVCYLPNGQMALAATPPQPGN